MKAKVSFYTFGCRLNQAETATLQRSFEKEGYCIVDFQQPADVVVVNTCTVTENGDADTRKLVNKINRRQPSARIALIGCQAQIQRESLFDLPNVRWVIGNSRKMEFARILDRHLDEKKPALITPVITRESFTHPVAGIDRQHTRANLKIQDGCDFFCSFCVIPYARGRARSREFNDLINEAEELVGAGHREIVLTGINIGTYHYRDKSLVDVINALERISGLERIRISSIELTTICPQILERMKKGQKLCRYLHIPLQSGSNEILSAMNRRYRVEEFTDFLELAERLIPDVCIGTDVIVGFPGETEEHFRETYRLLLDLPLAYFHVFSYSERPWTKSRKIENKIGREEIERRSRLLRELSFRKRQTFLHERVGTDQIVLFEQLKKGWWSGLTDTYIRVKVQSDEDLGNRIRSVRIRNVEGKSVIGELLRSN
ncbi:MAG: tRNA (N(6)-L-threonylcarbamoyladenosine(37)-C(2))-methylthiotransferase MtaB [Calditrichaeota bacterium]|nr:MAG: tRNA (N(6)-L-threonylcarbamoyladenosine(37)-C(2))-methylthiotransferase MtaB [Calditrichota bacterium]